MKRSIPESIAPTPDISGSSRLRLLTSKMRAEDSCSIPLPFSADSVGAYVGGSSKKPSSLPHPSLRRSRSILFLRDGSPSASGAKRDEAREREILCSK